MKDEFSKTSKIIVGMFLIGTLIIGFAYVMDNYRHEVSKDKIYYQLPTE